MDRRSFVAALSAVPFVAHLDSGFFLDRPGVQLYTVREAMAEDADRTLAVLAEIGYRDVELAGTYGMTPAAFRRRLDDAGATRRVGSYRFHRGSRRLATHTRCSRRTGSRANRRALSS